MEESKGLKDKIVFWLRDNYWLALILLVGVAIRWYGIYFDYPGGINFVWDETGAMMQLTDIVQTKNLFASTVNHYSAFLPIFYAPLLVIRVIYLMLANGLHSISEFKNFLLIDGMGNVYIIIRWASVAVGTASIYLIYLIFHYIEKNKVAAYLAALTCSFGIMSVFLSHWGKAHSAMVFFLLLSLYYSLRFEGEKSAKNIYLSSFFAACSISVHYLGIVAIIFPLLNVIFNWKATSYKVMVQAVLIGAVTTVFFYGANYKGVMDFVEYQDKYYYSGTNYTGMSNVSLPVRLTYIITDSWKIEPFLTSLTVLMLIFAGRILWKNKFNRYLIAGIACFYLIMITVIVLPSQNRWLLIFMSLAYPLSIVAFYNLVIKRYGQRIAVGLCMILIVPSTVYALKWDYVISRYTGVEAAQWLEDNTQKGDWLYSFYYNLYLPFSYQGALWNKENNGLSYKKIEYILNNQKDFMNRGYNLAYDFDKFRYEELAGKDTRYVIISSGERNDLDKQYQELKKYHRLTLVKSFDPFIGAKGNTTGNITNNPDNWLQIFDFKEAGPFVYIYKVK